MFRVNRFDPEAKQMTGTAPLPLDPEDRTTLRAGDGHGFLAETTQASGPRDTVEDCGYRSFGITDWVDRGLVRPGNAFGVHFRCRKCCGLGYRSQRKGREARGLEKAAQIKQQLGGSGAYADPVPERPKGMHHRTYERLCNEAEKAELPYQWRVMTRLQGLLEKSGLLPSIESDHPDQEQVMKAVQRAPERPELLKQTRRARRRGTRLRTAGHWERLADRLLRVALIIWAQTPGPHPFAVRDLGCPSRLPPGQYTSQKYSEVFPLNALL
jgi:hypothetical protein